MQELQRVVVASGKRKTAIARAVITPGKGRYRVNGKIVHFYAQNELARIKMLEPIILARGIVPVDEVDIDVSVRGGGFMGQANAVRAAVAKGLVEYFQSEQLRKVYELFDPWMLKDDPRRTLPHHGPTRSHRGPRARRQTSYR
ncbi:MAG: 30S ribosomal protein S9 [bacterium]|nr:30S ribosomal protein S9 [bacterium]